MKTLIFDLETQKAIDEVGGWKNTRKLMLSVGVVYDCSEERFNVYREEDAEQLIHDLRSADRVVGFNVIRFDYEVLLAYSPERITTPTVDMLQVIEQMNGHRVSLDSIAKGTLKSGKVAHGLEAVRWYREGKFDEIIHYCTEDVRITRDLYRLGAKQGYLMSIPPWGGALQKLRVAWPGESEA